MSDILYFFLGKEDKSAAEALVSDLVRREKTQFSYENITVAVSEDGILLGQACLYDGAHLQELRKPLLELLATRHDRVLELDAETQAGEIYLDTIAVSPAAQGKGVGTLLLRHVIDLHVHQRHETLGLLVDKTNPKAKALYLKLGFVVMQSRKIFGHDMEHLQLHHTPNT